MKVGTKYRLVKKLDYTNRAGLKIGDVLEYVGVDPYFNHYTFKLPEHLNGKGHKGLNYSKNAPRDYVYLDKDHVEEIKDTNVFKHFKRVSKVKLHVVDKNAIIEYRTTLESIPSEVLDEINDVLNKYDCEIIIYGKLGGNK